MNNTCTNCKHFNAHYPEPTDSNLWFQCKRKLFNTETTVKDWINRDRINDCKEYVCLFEEEVNSPKKDSTIQPFFLRGVNKLLCLIVNIVLTLVIVAFLILLLMVVMEFLQSYILLSQPL